MADAGPALAEELIAWCRQNLSAIKCPRSVTSRPSCRAIPPASSTSASCAIATGRDGRAGSSSVDFEAELPRHPTGKLYKRLLSDRYWQGRESRIV